MSAEPAVCPHCGRAYRRPKPFTPAEAEAVVTTSAPPPTSGRYGPDFYRGIAAAYVAVVSNGSRRPAAAIAFAHQVPLTTAHRWVREARWRGFLPRASPGRVSVGNPWPHDAGLPLRSDQE